MEYESHLWLLTLQGYNPPRDPLASVRVRVRVGQAQAAIPFCVWLLATCVFSSLLLDNIIMDLNMSLV